MFSLNEKVVYPGHGVAEIKRIIEKNVAGQEIKFYELSFLSKDATILVPIHGIKSVGIRKLSSSDHITQAFEILTKPALKLTSQEFATNNWNKRNKEYQSKLQTGKLLDLCEIYKDLRHMALKKELSFGEKNLLQHIESMLVEEISLVQQTVYEKTVQELRSLCTYNKKSREKYINF